MSPFFSIIIPVYNKENHIRGTMQSALNQAYNDFEIIVVNDGSTDLSEAQVKAFPDSRIQLFTIENRGVSAARNFGINQAKGQYIAFLDADDFWQPDHLITLKKLIESFPDCGLYASAYHKRLNNKIIKSEYNSLPASDWQGIVPDYFEASYINSIAWTSAVAVPKTILNDVGGFDEDITLGAGEDTDLWIRIALNHDVAFTKKVTAIHHLNSDNRLSDSNTNDRSFIDLDQYEAAAKNNASLKKYLDINRFSIGLQYRMASNKDMAISYFRKIDMTNLNKKQKLLMGCPRWSLNWMKRIQLFLGRLNVRLSPFK